MPHQPTDFRLSALARVMSAGMEVSVVDLSSMAAKTYSADARTVDYTTLDGAAKVLAQQSLKKGLRALANKHGHGELLGVEVKISLVPGQRAPRGFRDFKGWMFKLEELEPAQAAA